MKILKFISMKCLDNELSKITKENVPFFHNVYRTSLQFESHHFISATITLAFNCYHYFSLLLIILIYSIYQLPPYW